MDILGYCPTLYKTCGSAALYLIYFISPRSTGTANEIADKPLLEDLPNPLVVNFQCEFTSCKAILRKELLKLFSSFNSTSFID